MQIRQSVIYPRNNLGDNLWNTKELLQRLICTFCLSIYLGIVVGGEIASDLEHCEEVLPKFRYKLRSMMSGKPWWRKTSCIMIFAVSSLVMSLVYDKKCVILVYWSTTIKIALNPLEFRRSVIKSKDMDYHGLLGIGMAPINHKDDVRASLLCNIYHMFEHSLRQIYVYEATKMIGLLNPRF